MAVRHAAVLTVDDDSRFRGFLAALLESANFNVLEAEDASSAYAVTEKRRPDAAILDVNLPGVSGYSLCRELRTSFGPDLPVIFISGCRTDAIDRTAGMLIGGDDYLVKPVDPDELVARLHRLLERSRVWSKAPSHDLTEREIEVLQLIAEGYPPAEVAKRLVIAPKTVSSHMERILAKLDVHTRAQAVAVAYEAGLIRVAQRPEVVGHLMATSPSA
jgi:two-component system, NarL family, nitrate/nitrite response regulator NarL